MTHSEIQQQGKDHAEILKRALQLAALIGFLAWCLSGCAGTKYGCQQSETFMGYGNFKKH